MKSNFDDVNRCPHCKEMTFDMGGDKVVDPDYFTCEHRPNARPVEIPCNEYHWQMCSLRDKDDKPNKREGC